MELDGMRVHGIYAGTDSIGLVFKPMSRPLEYAESGQDEEV